MTSENGPGVVAGVDLGGTHVTVVLAGTDGAIVGRVEERVDRHAGPGPILGQIVTLVRGLVDGSSMGGSLKAVAIGCPGVIDHGRGVVVAAANLDGWRRV